MKRIHYCLLALATVMIAFCLAPLNAQQQGKKVQVFGVAFYNLENLFDTINNNGSYDYEFSPKGKNQWDSRRYWKKINNMAYSISQMTTPSTKYGPAIIGVSEVENRSVLEDLVNADAIKAWNLQVVHHDSPDRRGIDVSLLYNPRFFKLIRVTNHLLHIDSLPYFRTRDQMCVVGLLGGVRVGVIVNHWPSRRGGAEQSSWLREAAASLTKHIADSLLAVDPNIGIIVMGDLNDDPFNRSCAVALGGQKKQKDVEPGGFYNPFWEKLDKGIGSYTYKGGWNLFDQIMVNYNLLADGGSQLKFSYAEVLNKDFLKQQEGQYKGYPLRTFSSGVWTAGYSDHFPTEIFLTKEVK
jgi:hypothetical protein